MILQFGAQLSYEGPTDSFILSKNLASTLVHIEMIDKKLAIDLVNGQVEKVNNPSPPFLSSLLSLMPKHNRSWKDLPPLKSSRALG